MKPLCSISPSKTYVEGKQLESPREASLVVSQNGTRIPSMYRVEPATHCHAPLPAACLTILAPGAPGDDNINIDKTSLSTEPRPSSSRIHFRIDEYNP